MARAIEQVRSESDDSALRIDGMLRDEPWERVGAFCCLLSARRELEVAAMVVPPCWVRDLKAALAIAARPKWAPRSPHRMSGESFLQDLRPLAGNLGGLSAKTGNAE